MISCTFTEVQSAGYQTSGHSRAAGQTYANLITLISAIFRCEHSLLITDKFAFAKAEQDVTMQHIQISWRSTCSRP